MKASSGMGYFLFRWGYGTRPTWAAILCPGSLTASANRVVGRFATPAHIPYRSTNRHRNVERYGRSPKRRGQQADIAVYDRNIAHVSPAVECSKYHASIRNGCMLDI